MTFGNVLQEDKMKRNALGTIALAAIMMAVPNGASASAPRHPPAARSLTAFGTDSGPYHPNQGVFDKDRPIVTMIGGRLSIGENHVEGRRIRGHNHIRRWDSWNDTATSG